MVRTYQKSRSKAYSRTQLTPGRTVADLVEYDRMHYKHLSPLSSQHPSRPIGSPARTPHGYGNKGAGGLNSPSTTPRSIVKRMRKEPLSIQQFLAPLADQSTVLSDDDIVEVDDPILTEKHASSFSKKRFRARKLPVHRLRFTRHRSPELDRVPIVDSIQSSSSKHSGNVSDRLNLIEGHQRNESLDLGMMESAHTAHPLHAQSLNSHPVSDLSDNELLDLFDSPPSPILRAIENSEQSDAREITAQGIANDKMTRDQSTLPDWRSVLGFDDIGKPIKRY